MKDSKVDRLTASQRDALAAELAELEGPKRTAVVQAIKTARERLLQHGFGAIEPVEAEGVRFAPPLAPGRFAAPG